jgi:hypothetical protein
VPATVRRNATGLTPKPERAVASEDPREREMKHFVEASTAVRDGREAALDDWIDLYCAGQLESLAKGSTRPPVVRKIAMYSGRALDWLEWIALFRTAVHDVKPSVSARAGALRASLDPALVRECVTQSATERGYKESLMALKKKCGDRTILRISLTTLLLGLEPSAKAPGGRNAYAAEVKTRLRDLADIGYEDGSILDRLLSKLTETERLNWRMYAANGRDGIEHYGPWLQLRFEAGVDKYAVAEREAREYLLRENSRASIKPTSRRTRSRSPDDESRGRVHVVQGVGEKNGNAPGKVKRSSSQASTGGKIKCAFCSNGHKTFQCKKWKEATVPVRWTMVKESHVCANCLRHGHAAEKCDQFGPCNIDGCVEKHNRKLHAPAVQPSVTTGLTACAIGSSRGFVVRRQRPTVSLGFLKLRVRDRQGGWLTLMALVDEGSEISLVRKSIAKKLHWARRENTTLQIQGVGNVMTGEAALIGDLVIACEDGSVASATVTSMRDPVGPVPEVDWESLKGKWEHLADLPLTKTGGQIDLLLGIDNFDLIRAREIRNGAADGEPVAHRAKPGWFVRGPTGESGTSGVARNHVVVSHTLEGMFREFTKTESYGAELKAEPGFSTVDQVAVDAVEAGYVKLVEGVQVPVLYDGPKPSGEGTKERSLRDYRALQRRLRADSDLCAGYAKSMNKYFDKGYAR